MKKEKKERRKPAEVLVLPKRQKIQPGPRPDNPHTVHEHLASAAYYENPESIHGYKIDAALSDEETRVFVKKIGNARKVIISFRGTTNTKDIVTDVGIVKGERAGRFIKSLDQTKKVIEKYGRANVEVTGHSLGGTIARYISDKLGLKGKAFNPGASPYEAVRGHKESGRNVKTVVNFGDPISNSLAGGENVEIRIPSEDSPHSIEDPYNKQGQIKPEFEDVTKYSEVTQAEIEEEMAQNKRFQPGKEEYDAYRRYVQEKYDEEYRNATTKPTFEEYFEADKLRVIENHIQGEKAWRASVQEEKIRLNAGQKLSPKFQTKFQVRFVMASETLLSGVGAAFVVLSIIGPILWEFYKESDRVEKEAEKEKTFESREKMILDKEEQYIQYYNGVSKINLSKEQVNKMVVKHTPWFGRPYYTLDADKYKQLVQDESHWVLLPNNDTEKNTLFGPEAKTEPLPSGLELFAKPVEVSFGSGFMGFPAGDPTITYKLCYRAQDPGQLRYMMIPTLSDDLQMVENWFRFSYTLKRTAKLFESVAELNHYDGWLNEGFNVNKPRGAINFTQWWKDNMDQYFLYVAFKNPPLIEDPIDAVIPNNDFILSQEDFQQYLESNPNDPDSIKAFVQKYTNASDLLQYYYEWRLAKGFPDTKPNPNYGPAKPYYNPEVFPPEIVQSPRVVALAVEKLINYLNMYANDEQSVIQYIQSLGQAYGGWTDANYQLLWKTYNQWRASRGLMNAGPEIAGEEVLPDKGRFAALYEQQNRQFETQFHK